METQGVEEQARRVLPGEGGADRFSDPAIRRLAEADEAALCLRTAAEWEKRGVRLRSGKTACKTVASVDGPIEMLRRTLRPAGEKDAALLEKLGGCKTVVPLDSFIGISGMPCKTTPAFLVEAAFMSVEAESFENAEALAMSRFGVKLNDDALRASAIWVGRRICEQERREAEDAWRRVQAGGMPAHGEEQGTVWLTARTFALRAKGGTGLCWTECRLAAAFATNSEGEAVPAECIAFPGGSDDLKKRIIPLALRRGWTRFRNAAFIGQSLWLERLCAEIFPGVPMHPSLESACACGSSYGGRLLDDVAERIERASGRWSVGAAQCMMALTARFRSGMKDSVRALFIEEA